MKCTTPPPDPFRFGCREVQQIGADGSKQWVLVPLTAEEALHPREDYHIAENSLQCRDRIYLYDVLKWRLSSNPQALVLSDCRVNWGVAGLGHHMPDVCIFDGVRDPQQRIWRTFRVADEGARPVLTIEVVSPDAHDRRVRDNDVVLKVREYFRAGVPLYVLVDQERPDSPRQLIGYRRGARKYLRVRPNRQGCLLLAPARLLLGLRDERVVCWDADTGEEIADFTATVQSRNAEAQARQTAEADRDAAMQAQQAAEADRDAAMQARQAAEAALAAAQARIRELESQARPSE